jgi:hypothetical protein
MGTEHNTPDKKIAEYKRIITKFKGVISQFLIYISKLNDLQNKRVGFEIDPTSFLPKGSSDLFCVLEKKVKAKFGIGELAMIDPISQAHVKNIVMLYDMEVRSPGDVLEINYVLKELFIENHTVDNLFQTSKTCTHSHRFFIIEDSSSSSNIRTFTIYTYDQEREREITALDTDITSDDFIEPSVYPIRKETLTSMIYIHCALNSDDCLLECNATHLLKTDNEKGGITYEFTGNERTKLEIDRIISPLIHNYIQQNNVLSKLKRKLYTLMGKSKPIRRFAKFRKNTNHIVIRVDKPRQHRRVL